MYRFIFVLLLCCAARAAPQGSAPGSAEASAGDYDEADAAPPEAAAPRPTSPRTPARSFTRAGRPTQPSARAVSQRSFFDVEPGGAAINFVERQANRRFQSSCRCEKIWNCPKLQITVPRCPNEYYMCCL